MARYIKANPKVAQYLRLENDRNKVKDGNFLLWQADMLEFGRLTELPQILEQIGAISLQAHEAREEQDGTICRELPTATDPRFIVEKDDTKVDQEIQQPANDDNTEAPAETVEDPDYTNLSVGSVTDLEDGEYEAEGYKIVVKNGVVEEIIADPQPEQTGDAEATDELPEAAADPEQTNEEKEA